eukprot:TRINITY_DN37446_c0_g1_i1.p1 TRINITY_DN37446_c0_g1~~TRINITY_DN37446_c0_g1_i1.p1  ORF type:complete len:123 (-),score=21.46 TRINITY_DN37446_c0_g1_i1:80-448(-)
MLLVTLEGAKCLCSLQLVVDDLECSGQGRCGRRCSGDGSIEMGTSSFNLTVNKGKVKISNCKTVESSRFEESVPPKNTPKEAEGFKFKPSEEYKLNVVVELLQTVVSTGLDILTYFMFVHDT